MNYVLVPKEQLVGKGFDYAEQLKDGRVILNINVLKVLTGIKDVEVIDRASLLNLKKELEKEQPNLLPEFPSDNETLEEESNDSNVEIEKNEEVE